MAKSRAKAAIRLIGGPADGFVFSVPLDSIPPLVGVGPNATYRRDTGEGEVICYRFADSKPRPASLFRPN